MENQVWNLVETEILVRGAGWAEAQGTVKAMVFGKMITLAHDRVKHYRSDLFHDATWIAENLIGSMSFDWMARECGTWIGDVVAVVPDEKDSRKYRFEIICEDDRKWVLRTYEAGPVADPQKIHTCEQCGHVAGHYVDDMSMWLCSTTCTAAAQSRLSYDDEFYPYFSTEPLPEEVVERVMDMEPTHIKKEWTLGQLFEGPKLNFETGSGKISHESLPIEECDAAYTAAGCIYHPAPPMSRKFVSPDIQELAEMSKRVEELFPTLRNTKSTDNRKVTNMYRDSTVDSIRELLEEKLSDLQTKVEELNDARTEIDDAIEIAERNVEAVEEAINSLDLDLEDFSVEIDVSFSN